MSTEVPAPAVKARPSRKKPAALAGVNRANPPAAPLTVTTTLAEAFGQLYQKSAGVVVSACDAVCQSPTPDAVHALRVAVRRLRSALRQYRTEESAAIVAERDEALRDLARVVAPVRDLDVLRISVLPSIATEALADQMAGLDRVLGLLRTKRAKAALTEIGQERFKVLRAAIADDSAFRKTLLTADVSETLLGEHAQKRLHRALKRVRRRCESFKSADVEALHDIRISAKSLRYTFEHYSELYAEAQVEQCIDQLKKLQDSLGSLNDLTLTTYLDEAVSASDSDVRIGYAAGYVSGVMAARATMTQKQAHKAWKRLKATALVKRDFRLDQ